MKTSIMRTILLSIFTLLATLSYGQVFDWETATLVGNSQSPNHTASQIINNTYQVAFRMPNFGPINLTNAGQGTSGLSVRNSQPQPTVSAIFYPALNIQSIQVYATSSSQNWVFKSIDNNGNVLNTTTATVGTNLSTVTLNWTNVTEIEISKAEGWSGNYGVDDIVFTPYTAPCIVNIPDTNFKNYLISNSSINTNGNNEIECSEAAAFTGIIDVNNTYIIDLTGIETFTEIIGLNCSGCNIYVLDVSQNTKITSLNLASNQLTELNLSSNLLLQTLDIQDNLLYSLDVSTNSNLTFINANTNPLMYSLNVANGNNSNMSGADFNISNTPELNCITVDDIAYSTTNWTNVDVQINFSTDCSIPNPTVEMTTPTTALFSWDAITNATAYQVKYRLKGTTNWLTSGTSTNQRNVPNLTAKKYYQYKVRSQSADGTWSDFSDIGLFYTSTCDVPTGVASIYLDNTRMRIRWDNHPDEIKAKVRYREVGTSNWLTQNSQTGNNYIYINDLTPNATYQYRVRSNCDGNDWSAYTTSYFHDLNPPVQKIAVESTSKTKLYPNPAKDILFVEFDNAEKVSITITDGLGKIIQTYTNTDNNGLQQIDINHIPNGYYFVSIQRKNSIETLKFLKVD